MTSEDAGLRLDAFLAARGAAPSRSAAQRLIDAGAVAVDGRALAKNHRVSAGETVTVAEREALAQAAPDVDVVFEDEYLLVVDKPAGLVTHPAPGHHGPTLVDAVDGLPVHRLDRHTSGLLLVARTEAVRDALQADLKARRIIREYLALVSGHPDTESGTVDAPLGRDRRNRTLMSTRTDKPRSAVTHFEVEERLPRTALLRVRLETGRTHQIRAHLAAIDHPVCGDPSYGGRACGLRLGLDRQFLHATKLMFSHPATRETQVCESKPPVDLRRALDVAKREPVSGGPDGD
ncbi:MAG TPA: RluA family pseudouridine synthase [Thermoleophilaceae bacterium]|nr:RluA family pseudouridine synthase [Thermoleophilaceae bacterium]